MKNLLFVLCVWWVLCVLLCSLLQVAERQCEAFMTDLPSCVFLCVGFCYQGQTLFSDRWQVCGADCLQSCTA